MSRGRKRTRKSIRNSYYPLSEVVQKIDGGEVVINSNALQDAFDDFGWRYDNILKAYKMLRPRHYYKTDYSVTRPGFVLDFYKAHIMGEDIYTHFYIDDGNRKLVINSFKQDNTR